MLLAIYVVLSVLGQVGNRLSLLCFVCRGRSLGGRMYDDVLLEAGFGAGIGGFGLKRFGERWCGDR